MRWVDYHTEIRKKQIKEWLFRIHWNKFKHMWE